MLYFFPIGMIYRYLSLDWFVGWHYQTIWVSEFLFYHSKLRLHCLLMSHLSEAKLY